MTFGSGLSGPDQWRKLVKKAKLWSGGSLYGVWEFTIKLDGVRVLFTENGPVSRRGKPLYNLPTDHTFTDCECFVGSFKDTITATRTHNSTKIAFDSLYSLDPLDPRLLLGSFTDPTAAFILDKLTDVLSNGYEGLVLRQDNTWLKVKPEETYDVPITGIQQGKGRNFGRMGALLTPMGKVGTGFSDLEREELWNLGETIEVSCMHLTEDGLFRHPRFIRRREDK